MEWYRISKDLVVDIAWPSVALILSLVLLLVYRSDLGALIRDLRGRPAGSMSTQPQPGASQPAGPQREGAGDPQVAPPQSSAEEPSAVRAETTAFILEYTKDAPERQLSDIDALDSKMVQIFSAGSVVIGLTGLSRIDGTGGRAVDALFIVALFAYLGAAAAAFRHLQLRDFRRSLHADSLWRKYWNLSVTDIRHILIVDIASAYAHNARVYRARTKTVAAGLIFVTAEVFFVGLALIVARAAA